MATAHSKDNGSPTSVAHKLDDDQTDSVVVRRDDLVVIDNAALGSYGRVALEPGAAPPPGWMELMLVTHHQEPVGRCFQR